MNLHNFEHSADRARSRELNEYHAGSDRSVSLSESAYLDAADDVAANGDGAEELVHQIVDEFADLKALIVTAARMSGLPRHRTLPPDAADLGRSLIRLVRRELDAYCTRKSEEVS